MTVELAVKTYTPVLLEAGYAQLDVPIPLVGKTQAPVQVPATLNLRATIGPRMVSRRK